MSNMRKLKPTDEVFFESLKIGISALIALGVVLVVLIVIADDPFRSFFTMLTAPLTKVRYFSNVLEAMVPICFSGLACSLLFRTGLFNLGIEGVYYIGALAAAAVAIQKVDSSFLHPLFAILASAAVGAVVMLITGFLKARYQANELISSLMLNSILLGIGTNIIKTRIPASDYTSTATPLFQETARLTPMIQHTRLSIGILLACFFTAVTYVLMYKTKLGYMIRMTGENITFARYSGMNAFSLFLLVHVISGVLGGIGASVEILSIYDRFSWVALPGLGFTGALMAMMGKNHPIGIFIAAFCISYLKIGAEIMSRNTNVPVEIISIVEATLVLLISSQYFLRKLREKQLLKEKLLTAGGER